MTEMVGAGLCCASLEEPNALMKMGLSVVLIGHVNFLLGALVHGVVLRHINLHMQAQAMEYAITNVVALTSGLVGIVAGILAIILSKNKKSIAMMWSLFTVGLAAALMAAASAIGLTVSVARAVIHGRQSLLTHCQFPDATGHFNITNECPFDPTRIYSTTLILWVPLIVTCVIQMVFSARCFAVCISFLGLSSCPNGKIGRAINVVRPKEDCAPSHYAEPPTRYAEPPTRYAEPPTRYAEPPRRYAEPPTRYAEPPRRYAEPPRRYAEPPRRYAEPPRRYAEPPRRYAEPPRRYAKPPTRYAEPPTRNTEPPTRNTEPPRHQCQLPPPPKHLPQWYRSLPPSERQPTHQASRERSDREGQETRVGSQQRALEQHQLLERGTMERSSFWI